MSAQHRLNLIRGMFVAGRRNHPAKQFPNGAYQAAPRWVPGEKLPRGQQPARFQDGLPVVRQLREIVPRDELEEIVRLNPVEARLGKGHLQGVTGVDRDLARSADAAGAQADERFFQDFSPQVEQADPCAGKLIQNESAEHFRRGGRADAAKENARRAFGKQAGLTLSRPVKRLRIGPSQISPVPFRIGQPFV